MSDDFIQLYPAEHFDPEVLKAQDGKTIPLTLENGGPKIGEAILKYNEDEGILKAHLHIENPEIVAFLKSSAFDLYTAKAIERKNGK